MLSVIALVHQPILASLIDLSYCCALHKKHTDTEFNRTAVHNTLMLRGMLTE